MNNIFDFKRFGKYFLYDLRNAKNNYALSLLILGTLPITLFVVYQLFSLIFTQRFIDVNDAAKYMQFFIATTVAILGAGTKIYGNLTEKRSGANFLMIPASTFEKWLSMVLMVCIVLPVILLVLQFGSDALMALIFPNTYGGRFFELVPLQQVNDALTAEGISINLPAIFILDWFESVLTFTLGAICFKRSKVAKTILCLFACSMVLSMIGMIFVTGNGTMVIGWFEWCDRFASPAEAARGLNWLINISFFVFIGGLLGGIYYRLRTLKH
jgi:hypothetical protein